MSEMVSAANHDSKRKRILHIATRFLDGGSEQRLVDTVRALPSDEFEHHLVLGPEHDLDQVQERLGDCAITVEPHLRREISPRQDALALANLTRFIRRMRFDVVHTCQSKSGILGRTAARFAGTPMILHNLSMANFFEADSKFLSSTFVGAERVTATWTNAYFVVGEDLKDRYLKAGISKPDRFHVVRSSIELDRFRQTASMDVREARATLGLPQEGRVVAYVGSLQSRKGVMQLPAYLKALSEMSEQPVRLVVAGGGELSEPLKAAFGSAGLLDSVSFLGYTREVPTVMAAADCMILLSEAEGLPQVLVQAAAVQRPFVAYPVDGTVELKKLGAAGAIVEERVPAAAARATSAYFDCARPAPVDLSDWEADRVRQQYRSLLRSRSDERRAAESLDLVGGRL